MTPGGFWDAVDATRTMRDLNERLVQLVEVPHNGAILDLGSGTAAISGIVLKREPSARVLAVDPDEEMLSRIESGLRSRIDCIRAKAEDIDEKLPSNCFDRVFLANCVHLFNDRLRAFEAIRAVLKPGGWMAMNTTLFEKGQDPATAHLYRELVLAAASILLNKSCGSRLSRRRVGVANRLESSEIRTTLEKLGFECVRAVMCEAVLNVETLTDVVGSRHFASSLFPDITPDLAAEVMRTAVDQVLARNKVRAVRRNWLFLIACKEGWGA